MTIRTRHATALVIVMLAVLVVGAGATTHTVNIGPNQQLIFSDQQTGKPTTTINVGDTVQWVWQGMHHSTTSGSCATGTCIPDPPSAAVHWDSGVNDAPHTFSFT